MKTLQQIAGEVGCRTEMVRRHAQALGVGRKLYEGLYAPWVLEEEEARKVIRAILKDKGCGRPLGGARR